MIEVHADVWITQRGFDHGGVERRPADRVDVLVRVAIVRSEMEFPCPAVNHAAAHRDRVSQHFIGDAELLERMNPARGERQIDRPSADEIARARIGPALIKLDLVSAPPEIRRQQSAG